MTKIRGKIKLLTKSSLRYSYSVCIVENPGDLSPIRHTNLALNDAGVRGVNLCGFSNIAPAHALQLVLLFLVAVVAVAFVFVLHLAWWFYHDFAKNHSAVFL